MSECISCLDLLAMDIPPVEWLIDGFIPRAGLVYSFGAPGSFKSSFLLHVALQGANGSNFCGFNVKKPFKTLWIDEEMRNRGMKDKTVKIMKGIDNFDMSNMQYFRFLISDNFDITNKAYLTKLKCLIIEHKPDMVVIDSLSKVFPLDERNEKDVKIIYRVLAPLMEEFSVTFVIIHHARKKSHDQYSRGMEDISGSREFAAAADAMFLTEEYKDGVFRIKQVKNRHALKKFDINIQVTESENQIRVEYKGETAELSKKNKKNKVEEAAQAIIKWTLENDITEFRRGEVAIGIKHLGIGNNSLNDGLKLLKNNNRLIQPIKNQGYKVVVG